MTALHSSENMTSLIIPPMVVVLVVLLFVYGIRWTLASSSKKKERSNGKHISSLPFCSASMHLGTATMVSKAKRNLLPSGHLLLPPSMKNFASCFSEHAVKVSEPSCSGSSSSGGNSLVVDTSCSVLSAVTCLYRTRLIATQRELLIRVAWSKGHAGPMLSVGIDDNPSVDRWEPNAMNCQLLMKKKGSRAYAAGDCAVRLHWDISSAKFGSGPEPIDGFYVVMVVNSELALSLGDMSEECTRRFEEALPVAESSMISRKEQVIGQGLHSTRARFREDGGDHEITIRCKEDGWDAKESELSVTVDKKRVVHVRRLRWNFRGNQTLFIDGSPVDMMWDMHGWRFGNAPGWAVFMFRKRSALESRLWLEEETVDREQGGASGFSLLIQQAFKST
ncbi:uncharacterized protein LOC135606185 [Musa acuminata AAA Group]|uniref:uncharacterized protein LOC135606185 n=1 Tax=Musa acuminata AAA Group TaxID=214697 RepID=UPI0031D1BBD5